MSAEKHSLHALRDDAGVGYDAVFRACLHRPKSSGATALLVASVGDAKQVAVVVHEENCAPLPQGASGQGLALRPWDGGDAAHTKGGIALVKASVLLRSQGETLSNAGAVGCLVVAQHESPLAEWGDPPLRAPAIFRARIPRAHGTPLLEAAQAGTVTGFVCALPTVDDICSVVGELDNQPSQQLLAIAAAAARCVSLPRLVRAVKDHGLRHTLLSLVSGPITPRRRPPQEERASETFSDAVLAGLVVRTLWAFADSTDPAAHLCLPVLWCVTHGAAGEVGEDRPCVVAALVRLLGDEGDNERGRAKGTDAVLALSLHVGELGGLGGAETLELLGAVVAAAKATNTPLLLHKLLVAAATAFKVARHAHFHTPFLDKNRARIRLDSRQQADTKSVVRATVLSVQDVATACAMHTHGLWDVLHMAVEHAEADVRAAALRLLATLASSFPCFALEVATEWGGAKFVSALASTVRSDAASGVERNEALRVISALVAIETGRDLVVPRLHDCVVLALDSNDAATQVCALVSLARLGSQGSLEDCEVMCEPSVLDKVSGLALLSPEPEVSDCALAVLAAIGHRRHEMRRHVVPRIREVIAKGEGEVAKGEGEGGGEGGGEGSGVGRRDFAARGALARAYQAAEKARLNPVCTDALAEVISEMKRERQWWVAGLWELALHDDTQVQRMDSLLQTLTDADGDRQEAVLCAVVALLSSKPSNWLTETGLDRIRKRLGELLAAGKLDRCPMALQAWAGLHYKKEIDASVLLPFLRPAHPRAVSALEALVRGKWERSKTQGVLAALVGILRSDRSDSRLVMHTLQLIAHQCNNPEHLQLLAEAGVVDALARVAHEHGIVCMGLAFRCLVTLARFELTRAGAVASLEAATHSVSHDARMFALAALAVVNSAAGDGGASGGERASAPEKEKEEGEGEGGEAKEGGGQGKKEGEGVMEGSKVDVGGGSGGGGGGGGVGKDGLANLALSLLEAATKGDGNVHAAWRLQHTLHIASRLLDDENSDPMRRLIAALAPAILQRFAALQRADNLAHRAIATALLTCLWALQRRALFGDAALDLLQLKGARGSEEGGGGGEGAPLSVPVPVSLLAVVLQEVEHGLGPQAQRDLVHLPVTAVALLHALSLSPPCAAPMALSEGLLERLAGLTAYAGPGPRLLVHVLAVDTLYNLSISGKAQRKMMCTEACMAAVMETARAAPLIALRRVALHLLWDLAVHKDHRAPLVQAHGIVGLLDTILRSCKLGNLTIALARRLMSVSSNAPTVAPLLWGIADDPDHRLRPSALASLYAVGGEEAMASKRRVLEILDGLVDEGAAAHADERPHRQVVKAVQKVAQLQDVASDAQPMARLARVLAARADDELLVAECLDVLLAARLQDYVQEVMDALLVVVERGSDLAKRTVLAVVMDMSAAGAVARMCRSDALLAFLCDEFGRKHPARLTNALRVARTLATSAAGVASLLQLPTLVPALCALVDKSRSMRSRALETLATMAKRSDSLCVALVGKHGIVPILMRVLGENDEVEKCVLLLLRVGRVEANQGLVLPVLREVVRSEDKELRARAFGILFREAPDLNMRRHVVREAVKQLDSAKPDDVPFAVRTLAAMAKGRGGLSAFDGVVGGLCHAARATANTDVQRDAVDAIWLSGVRWTDVEAHDMLGFLLQMLGSDAPKVAAAACNLATDMIRKLPNASRALMDHKGLMDCLTASLYRRHPSLRKLGFRALIDLLHTPANRRVAVERTPLVDNACEFVSQHASAPELGMALDILLSLAGVCACHPAMVERHDMVPVLRRIVEEDDQRNLKAALVLARLACTGEYQDRVLGELWKLAWGESRGGRHCALVALFGSGARASETRRKVLDVVEPMLASASVETRVEGLQLACKLAEQEGNSEPLVQDYGFLQRLLPSLTPDASDEVATLALRAVLLLQLEGTSFIPENAIRVCRDTPVPRRLVQLLERPVEAVWNMSLFCLIILTMESDNKLRLSQTPGLVANVGAVLAKGTRISDLGAIALHELALRPETNVLAMDPGIGATLAQALDSRGHENVLKALVALSQAHLWVLCRVPSLHERLVRASGADDDGAALSMLLLAQLAQTEADPTATVDLLRAVARGKHGKRPHWARGALYVAAPKDIQSRIVREVVGLLEDDDKENRENGLQACLQMVRIDEHKHALAKDSSFVNALKTVLARKEDDCEGALEVLWRLVLQYTSSVHGWRPAPKTTEEVFPENARQLVLAHHVLPLVADLVGSPQEKVAEQAVRLLRALSYSGFQAQTMAQEGVVDALKAATTGGNQDRVFNALDVLQSLVVDRAAALHLVGEGLVDVAVANMEEPGAVRNIAVLLLGSLAHRGGYEVRSKLIEMGIIEVLEPISNLGGFAGFRCTHILAILIGKEETQRFDFSHVVDQTITFLRNVWQSGQMFGFAWDISDPLHAIRRLSISDKLKPRIATPETVELLKTILDENQDGLACKYALGSLFELSFLYDDDSELVEKLMPPELGLVKTLQDKKEALTGVLRQNAVGLLSRLTGEEEREAEEEGENKREEAVAGGGSQGPQNTKHIMLSYSWKKNKDIVVAFARRLRELGYDVWRDEEGSAISPSMRGSVDEAMAEAIDKAAVVICFLSKHYKESPNCRQEGRYANEKRKRGALDIKFVLVDDAYKEPDGWVGIMLAGELWYPLWEENQLEDTIAGLVDTIGDKAKIGAAQAALPLQPAPDQPVPATKKVAAMSVEEVGEWLQQHGLGHYRSQFQKAKMRGASIMGVKTALEKGLYDLAQFQTDFQFVEKGDLFALLSLVLDAS